MKCILVSRFGANNIGDLAISNEIYKKLSSKFEVDIYNFSGPSQSVKDIDKVVFNRDLMIKKEKFKRSLKNLRLDWALTLLSKAKSLLKKPPTASKDNFSDLVETYDVAVIAGGNMLMGLTAVSNSIKFFSDHVEAANKAKVPIFVLDIGIGPFFNKAQTKAAVEALNKCEAISFRDKQSYDLFEKYGGDISKASVSVDPVFLLENKRDKKVEKKVNIGVNIFDSSLIGFSKKDYQKTISAYAQLINDLIDKHKYTVSLYTTTLIDELTLDLVVEKVENKDNLKVVAVNGLKDLLDLYGSLDAIVGTRMHSIIIAFSQKLPFVGLSWQPKVNAMFEIIAEEDFLFDFYKFNNSVDQIIEKINLRLNNIEEDREKMSKKRLEIENMAKVNDDILDKFIESKV